ncbi:hypothetical protein HDU67_009964 [Dinochytrium kinnereticum]|nr:hypothetical protein HDU67_009964 [Dinochytrium kinnereticum]
MSKKRLDLKKTVAAIVSLLLLSSLFIFRLLLANANSNDELVKDPDTTAQATLELSPQAQQAQNNNATTAPTTEITTGAQDKEHDDDDHPLDIEESEFHIEPNRWYHVSGCRLTTDVDIEKYASGLHNIAKWPVQMGKTKDGPNGRFFVQPASKRGIGNAVAEYNFGIMVSIMHNLTRIHSPLRCARISDEDCESIFRLSSLNPWSLAAVEEKVSEGTMKEVMIHQKKPIRENVDREIDNVTDTNVLIRLDFSAASYSFKYTRLFWSAAYAFARKTHPWPCEYSKDPHKLHVAVHVRHGDVLRFAQKGFTRLTKLRYLPLEYFQTAIGNLFELFNEDRVSLHLFSDGKKEDLKPLLDAFTFASFTNSKPLQSLHLLAAADILICSKSGFSQLAAVVGSGGGGNIKLIPEGDWPSYDGIPNTITITDDVLQNKTAFSQMLNISVGNLLQPQNLTVNAWYCPKRSCGVVRQAVLSALKSDSIFSSFAQTNLTAC